MRFLIFNLRIFYLYITSSKNHIKNNLWIIMLDNMTFLSIDVVLLHINIGFQEASYSCVHVVQSLVFFVSTLVYFLLTIVFACPSSIYRFLLPIWYLQNCSYISFTSLMVCSKYPVHFVSLLMFLI